ncbi:PQQ-binding-like beta-propeller repeat protein [Natronomonas amylolytica]|uniref:outer membrane protein assembly factor BamB family protein n=1 Tax=Natronomonas amylolytica TaxID=3108498 RepID=UPI003008C510
MVPSRSTRRAVLAAGAAGIASLAGCLGSSASAGPVPPGSDYPMDRYAPGRAATVTDALEPPASLGVSWSLSVPSTATPPPSIHAGRAYLNDWAGTLFALDATEGTTDWSVSLGDEEAGGTRPTVDESGIYTATRSGLFAHDHDGTQRWHADDVSSARGSPVVVDGTVYVTYVSTVKAFDAATGDLLWSTTPGEAYGAGTVTLHRTLAVADGTVYAVRERGGHDVPDVFALNADDGSERWHAGTGLVYHRPVVTPEGDLVTVGQRQVEPDAPDEHIDAWDVVVRWTDDGEPAWQTELDGYRTYTQPAVDGQRVYAPTTAGIEAVSLADGDRLWQAGDGLTGAPVVAGDHVWVRAGDTSDGRLRVYTRAGEAVATYGKARTRPAVTANAVYLVRPGAAVDTLLGDPSEVVALVPP